MSYGKHKETRMERETDINNQPSDRQYNAKFGLYWFQKADVKLVSTPRLTHTQNITSRVGKTQKPLHQGRFIFR